VTRLASYLIVLCILWPSTARAGAQGDDPPPNTVEASRGSNTITVDLNAGTQIGHVQFDVPIVLHLTLDNDVTRVDVFKADRAKKAACDDSGVFEKTNTWRRFSLGRTPVLQQGTEPKTAVYLTSDPVDANHYICFKFTVVRVLSETELRAFTTEAVKIADENLRVDTRPLRIGFTDGQIENVRQALRRVLGVTVPLPTTAVRREVERGSMLSETPTAESRTAFGNFLAAVFGATRNRDLIIESLNRAPGEVDAAAAAIVALATDPFLATYDERLTAAGTSNALLATAFAAAHQAIVRIRTIADTRPAVTNGNARAIGLGLPFGTVETVLFGDMWKVDEVTPRATVVQGWLDSFQAVNRFAVQAPPALTPPFVADDISRLQRELNDATGKLGQVFSTILGLQQALKARQDAVTAFADAIGNQVAADAFVGTNSFADFNTRSTWYLSADIGVASSPKLKSVFFYVGGNVYFRPVNKEAPLSLRGGFGRRFSAVIGASIGSDLVRSGQIENSVNGNRQLLLGAGFRITDILRAGAGFVIVKALNPNPLITTDPEFQRTPYFGLSIDWDAKKTFADAFNGSNK
jgi:hypothetical protein